MWQFGKGLPYIYASKEILVDFNLAVAKIDCQTAKFIPLPDFPSIQ